jgi:hypothetical protein
MLGCRADCLHRLMVQDYRSAREHDEARMERETRLFPGDVAIWKQANYMITFKDWLVGRRDWNREDLAG